MLVEFKAMTNPMITPAEAALAGAVSIPLTKLIASISKGIGKWYEPIGIVREAKAQAEAGLTLAAATIEQQELFKQALHRMAYVATRRQANINSITEEAKNNLPETVSDDPVSEDWMVKFFENCKDVGEKELQKLWAHLLVGEVAKPRTFSRRTMEILRTFDPEDARTFTAYCEVSFSRKSGEHLTFITTATLSRLAPPQIKNAEQHLVSLGLLNAESEPLGLHGNHPLQLDYFENGYVVPTDALLILSHFTNPENTLRIRQFTAVGNELARVIPCTQVSGFVEMLREELGRYQVRLLTAEQYQEEQNSREKGRNG